MDQKTKNYLRDTVAITLALVMLMPIVGYFIAGYMGQPFYIILRFVFAAVITNSLGIMALANLGVLSPAARVATGSLLGLYAALGVTLGAFVSGINTFGQIYALLSLAILAMILGGVAALQTKNTLKAHIPGMLVFIIASGIFVYGLATQQTILVFQNYQRALGIGGIIGALAFLPIWRKWPSRIFHLGADTPTTVVILALGPLVLGFLAYALAIFNSLKAIASGLGGMLLTPSIVLGQLALFILLAFISVGWLTRRNLKETLARLGLTKPTLATLKSVVVFSIGIFVINYVLEYIGAKTGLLDIEASAEQTKQLLHGFGTLPLAILLASAAGIGEEILFRGAIQPRFGLIATSLAFTFLHIQYNWYGMLVVFAIGLALGYQRKCFSTTATILTHLIYDLVGILIIFNT